MYILSTSVRDNLTIHLTDRDAKLAVVPGQRGTLQRTLGLPMSHDRLETDRQCHRQKPSLGVVCIQQDSSYRYPSNFQPALRATRPWSPVEARSRLARHYHRLCADVESLTLRRCANG